VAQLPGFATSEERRHSGPQLAVSHARPSWECPIPRVDRRLSSSDERAAPNPSTLKPFKVTAVSPIIEFHTKRPKEGQDMKVSNNQNPSEGDEGVSRKTLNDWQRKDADLQKQDESARGKKSENEVGKQAEG